MSNRQPDQVFDVEFSVPFVHRLRFTHDVFGADAQTLVDVLEPAHGQPARLQFWIDSRVAEAQPELPQRIYTLSKKFRDSITLAGNVQIVPGGEEVKNDIPIEPLGVRLLKGYDRPQQIFAVGGSLRQSHSQEGEACPPVAAVADDKQGS